MLGFRDDCMMFDVKIIVYNGETREKEKKKQSPEQEEGSMTGRRKSKG